MSPEHRIPAEMHRALSRRGIILTDVKEIGRLRPELNARRNPFNQAQHRAYEAGDGTLVAVVTRAASFTSEQ